MKTKKTARLPLKKPLMTVEQWQAALRRTRPDATEKQIAAATAWAIMFNVVEAPKVKAL